MLIALWHKSETSTKNVIQLKLFGVHKSMLTQLDHYDSMAVVGGGMGGGGGGGAQPLHIAHIFSVVVVWMHAGGYFPIIKNL